MSEKTSPANQRRLSASTADTAALVYYRRCSLIGRYGRKAGFLLRLGVHRIVGKDMLLMKLTDCNVGVNYCNLSCIIIVLLL